MHLLRFFLFILIVVVLTGCFQTKLEAPPGREVRILSKEEPAKFKKEYKNWYLFYGIIPVWTTQPKEIIIEENLVEARAQTKDTVSDAIITFLSSFLPILIFPQHVIVEGNRKSDLPIQPLPANNGISLAIPASGNQPSRRP
jgi:hypothetical protein